MSKVDCYENMAAHLWKEYSDYFISCNLSLCESSNLLSNVVVYVLGYIYLFIYLFIYIWGRGQNMHLGTGILNNFLDSVDVRA